MAGDGRADKPQHSRSSLSERRLCRANVMTPPVVDEPNWEIVPECGACSGRGLVTLLDHAPLHYVRCDGCQAVRLYRRVVPDKLGLVY